MRDALTRAQHYRELEKQMCNAASQEQDLGRRTQLSELATQYRRLANKLVEEHIGERD